MKAAAYLNQGRWVADCPVPYCAGAERVWPELRHLSDGREYGIYRDKMHCAECGTVSDVVFPDEREQIDRVVSARKVPSTRNWNPGETLSDLDAENQIMGV
jgi:uncharacterized Zn finger protein